VFTNVQGLNHCHVIVVQNGKCLLQVNHVASTYLGINFVGTQTGQQAPRGANVFPTHSTAGHDLFLHTVLPPRQIQV